MNSTIESNARMKPCEPWFCPWTRAFGALRSPKKKDGRRNGIGGISRGPSTPIPNCSQKLMKSFNKANSKPGLRTRMSRIQIKDYPTPQERFRLGEGYFELFRLECRDSSSELWPCRFRGPSLF